MQDANKLASERAVAARREYQRRWRANNPDRVRRYNRRYWENVAAKKAEGGDFYADEQAADAEHAATGAASSHADRA